MKNILFLLTILIFSSVAIAQNQENSILQRNYEFKMISSGDNRPDFNIRKDSMNFLLIYLHEGKSLAEFKNDTKLSDETIDQSVILLKNKNWLHEIDGQLKPTVFIATAKDGKELYCFAEPVASQIAEEARKSLSEIKAEFAKTKMSQKFDFQHWSFFILSNVLLDNGNIFNMENLFFKRADGSQYKRPLRHGKNYYASILENTNKNSEAFEIYGNQLLKSTHSLQVDVYGNNRYADNRYQNLSSSENRITAKDTKILSKIAQIFLPKLLNVLENNRSYAEEVYKKTGYSQEITFEEFFIWWYHFIYSQATNDMQNMGLLTVPSSGNFDYEIDL